MGSSRYERIREDGYVFWFAYDRKQPNMLHIYAAHGATVDDALGVWFDPDASQTWNEQQKRFETRGESHVVYWTWLYGNDGGQHVLIMTCFPTED